MDSASTLVHCRTCGYCLGGLEPAGRCPECGEAFDREELLAAQGVDLLEEAEEYGPTLDENCTAIMLSLAWLLTLGVILQTVADSILTPLGALLLWWFTVDRVVDFVMEHNEEVPKQ